MPGKDATKQDGKITTGEQHGFEYWSDCAVDVSILLSEVE